MSLSVREGLLWKHIATQGGLGLAGGWKDSSRGCQASFYLQPHLCLCNGAMNTWAIFAGIDDIPEAKDMDFSPGLAIEIAT